MAGFDPLPQETTSPLDARVVSPAVLREGRLCSEMAAFGISDADIASTLRIPIRRVSLRIFAYYAHFSGYGAYPFPMFRTWYATDNRRPHVLAVPELQRFPDRLERLRRATAAGLPFLP